MQSQTSRFGSVSPGRLASASQPGRSRGIFIPKMKPAALGVSIVLRAAKRRSSSVQLRSDECALRVVCPSRSLGAVNRTGLAEPVHLCGQVRGMPICQRLKAGAGDFEVARMAKATKVLVAIPDDLLERIDRETENLGQTRRDFLQEAARRRLGWPDPLAVDAALLRGRAALAGLGSFESTRALLDAHKERTVAPRFST